MSLENMLCVMKFARSKIFLSLIEGRDGRDGRDGKMGTKVGVKIQTKK